MFLGPQVSAKKNRANLGHPASFAAVLGQIPEED